MKRICIFIVLSFICGSAMSQNPVKVKTSEPASAIEQTILNSFSKSAPRPAKERLRKIVKERDMDEKWLDSIPKTKEPVDKPNPQTVSLVTLTKNYDSLEDVDFGEEPELVKISEPYYGEKIKTTNQLLYNENAGIWILERNSGTLSLQRIYYNLELIDGNVLKMKPFLLILS